MGFPAENAGSYINMRIPAEKEKHFREAIFTFLQRNAGPNCLNPTEQTGEEQSFPAEKCPSLQRNSSSCTFPKFAFLFAFLQKKKHAVFEDRLLHKAAPRRLGDKILHFYPHPPA